MMISSIDRARDIATACALVALTACSSTAKIDDRQTTETDQGVGMLEPSKKTNAPMSKVCGDELRDTGCMTLLEAMDGMMAGVEVYDNDEGIQHVSIRGSRSQGGNVVPLYIVDGHEVPHLMNVSINEVKDVEVLKDAAIYGVKGANGAVIVHLIR